MCFFFYACKPQRAHVTWVRHPFPQSVLWQIALVPLGAVCTRKSFVCRLLFLDCCSEYVFQMKCTTLQHTSCYDAPWHIISDVSFGHWVFQQSDNLTQLALSVPQFSSPDPQPPWSNSSAASVAILMVLQLVVPVMPSMLLDSAEGLSCEPSASHLNGLAPHSPPIALALYHWLSVLCPLHLIGFSNAVLPGNGEE